MSAETSSTRKTENSGLRVLIESDAGSPVAPIAAGAYTLGGSTANFDVYYDSSLGAGGQALANAVLASCEADLVELQQFFGVSAPGRFATYLDPGTGGASHAGCFDTNIHCHAWTGDGGLENFLNCAEVDEVLMATQGAGWNCGASAGEGLSRVLAFELHPATQWLSANQNHGFFVTASNWLNGGRPDWVTQTESTDQDKVSIGCATLFLNYLRYQLHFDLFQIVAAGGTTLQQTYQRLTGLSDAFGPFAALLALHFPPGINVNLMSDNPFPLRVPAFFDLTTLTSSAQPAGNPFGYFNPADGLLHAIYRGGGGDLSEVWWLAGDKGSNDLTKVSKAPPAASDPAAYCVAADGTQHVIYRAGNGHLYELWWTTGAVGVSDLMAGPLSPGATGNPAAYFNPADGNQHAIYRTGNGHIYEMWWTTGPVGRNDLTSYAGAPNASGDPAAYPAADGTQHVVYRAANGHIFELWWTTGAVSRNDLTTLTQAPPAAGDPAAYYDAAEGTHHAICRTGNGHLYELWWGKLTGANDLTGFAKAQPSVSDPSAYFADREGTHHVIYRTGDNHLHELSWTTGAVTDRDLTALALAPTATGKPFGWFTPGDSLHHVLYCGTDHHLYELRWNIAAAAL
jgi:hypothetical protein